MNYVRQHYNLATTGKLGQKGSGSATPKSGSSKSHSSSSSQKGSVSSPSSKKMGY